MPLSSWSLCSFWHHQPQHLNHSSLISVRYPCLCSLLVQVLSSYLSSRSFRVKCDNNLFSLHTSSCDVPQGSVLGPLFFIMYTTPLSTPISSLPLTTTIYADDSCSRSTHSTLTQALRTFKTLFSRSLPKWLLIFSRLTPLRLNSCSSGSKTRKRTCQNT